MTFNEVLARVQFNIWGNTIPPANVAAMLGGANGIIARAHHNIQREHNYWFMQTWAEITSIYNAVTEEYTQAYAIPVYMKEIINVLWHTVDSEGEYNGFTSPLSQLTLGQSQDHFWKRDTQDSVEYPTHFEVVNNLIIFYPDGNCARTCVINFWRYIDCLLGDLEDALMREGPEAVINMATAEVYLHLHEVELYQLWTQRYREEAELLRKKDYSRRRAHINEMGTQAGM